MKEEIRNTMEQIVEQCVTSDKQKVRVLKTRADPQDFDCYKKAVKTFSKNCYNLGQVAENFFCIDCLSKVKRLSLSQFLETECEQ